MLIIFLDLTIIDDIYFLYFSSRSRSKTIFNKNKLPNKKNHNNCYQPKTCMVKLLKL